MSSGGRHEFACARVYKNAVRYLRKLLTLARTISVIIVLLLTGLVTARAAAPKLLSNPSTVERADRALILIHGLLGSPVNSFSNWPAIIANDHTQLPGHGEMSDFAVYAADYMADFSSTEKLDDVAIGVAHDIEASDIFRQHRHIWIVAHSMGGLVLKRIVALWTLQKKTLYLDRVLGVGLLGVPSAGAPLADLAKEYSIDSIASAFGWNGALVQDLTSYSGSYLDSLEADWMAVRAARNDAPERRFTPMIYCGFETKPEFKRTWWNALFFYTIGRFFGQPNIDLVVPKLFTSTVCDDRRGFSVSHTDLIKPRSATDSIHLWLRQLVEKSIVAGLQEPRVELTTVPPSSDPVNFNLASRVEHSNSELLPENRDRATLLPKQPELILFGDERSKQLALTFLLQGGPFTASTKLDAWQTVATKNTCLEVTHSPNRMTIFLAMNNAQAQQCPNGASICTKFSCNER
jgi:pimeloyl-ACP methyl ester carboxylesterase